MPSSAEVNSIKQSWLYGRAQQRGIEQREIWKKTRNLNISQALFSTQCTGMHSTQWHTDTSSRKPPAKNKKKKQNRILEIKKKNKSWGFTSRGKQSTLAVTCSEMQDCCWCLVSLFFDDDIGFPFSYPFSQWSPSVTLWFPQSYQSRWGPSMSSSPTAAQGTFSILLSCLSLPKTGIVFAFGMQMKPTELVSWS